MTYTVHKQILKIADIQSVMLPMGATILCAREQHNDICVWYRCDPDVVVKKERQIAICGTGHPAPSPDDGRYIGTAFLHGGDLVFHVFERIHLVIKS